MVHPPNQITIALMEPGEHFYRHRVGLHAFDVDGITCLASAYLEEAGDDYLYRYAVLCGGEAARRAVTVARLDAGDSDEPGPGRRAAIATYSDFDDFLYRLPKYLGDVNRRLDARRRDLKGRGSNQRRPAASRGDSPEGLIARQMSGSARCRPRCWFGQSCYRRPATTPIRHGQDLVPDAPAERRTQLAGEAARAGIVRLMVSRSRAVPPTAGTSVPAPSCRRSPAMIGL